MNEFAERQITNWLELSNEEEEELMSSENEDDHCEENIHELESEQEYIEETDTSHSE